MRHDPRWWLERLRAMSLGEVVHRSARLARAPIDLARARGGRFARSSPRLACWRGPEVFVFDAATARAPLPDELRAAAEGYVVGRQPVLGLGEVLAEAPWHFEPRANGFWPLRAAGRVVAGAPADFDPRTTWELNRGHGWVVLARAYAATGEPRFRDRLWGELRSWQRGNPLGIGINWVSAMEAAIRCHAFAWIAALMRAAGEADAAAWRVLGELLCQHAAFVARNLSRFSSANNHLLVELSGLAVAGRVLDVGRWRDRALGELAREAERQTLADGVNAEMATHYHLFVLEALLLVAWLERAHGTPARTVEDVIARMTAYVDAIRLRSGAVLDQGDNDDGKLLPVFEHRHAEQLCWAAHALRATGGGELPPGDGARLLCNGAAPAAYDRPARSQRFRAGGQVVLRGPRLHATFDAGPFGFGTLAAHAHCDALALSVAFDDRPLLVERGTYLYNGDRAARDRLRATAAHNTVQLGAREQGEMAGPFLWSRKPIAVIEHCVLGAGARDVVRASHDGFAPARHVRTVLRIGDVLAVIDELCGAPAGEPVVARWHLAPGVVLGALDDGPLHVRDAGGERWLWFTADDRPLRARVIATAHSARYLAEEPACTLEIVRPDARRRLVTIVGPDARTCDAELRAMRAAIAEAP